MKNIVVAISFTFAIPFLILGFVWHFMSYCFSKGREVCSTFFEFLE